MAKKKPKEVLPPVIAASPELQAARDRFSQTKQAVQDEINFGSDVELGSYDSGLRLSDVPHLEDYRGKNQSWGSKIGNGAVKAIGTAATSALEPFVDLTVGTLEAAINGDASKLYNNTATQALDNVNKSLQNAFPNYYQEYEKEGIHPLTANFWGDKVGNGLGFMLGAVASGSVVGKVAGAGVNALRGKWFSKIVEAAAASGGDTAIFNEYLNGSKSLVAKTLFNDELPATVASFVGALGEAGIEGRSTLNEVYDTQLSLLLRSKGIQPTGNREQDELKINDEEKSRLAAIASDAGNGVFLANAALVGVADKLQFGSFFKKGFKENKLSLGDLFKREAKNEVGDITYEGGKYALDKSILGKYRGAAMVLADPLTEAGQEMSQGMISRGYKDYYSKGYDPDNHAGMASMIDSMGSAFRETLGSSEGWEEGLLGGIISAISGGPMRGLSQAREENAKQQAIVDRLNANNFSDSFNALVRHQTIQEQKDMYLEAGDMFNYKNAESEQFFNMIDSRIKAGRFDDVVDELEKRRDMKAEQFEKETGVAQSTVSFDKLIERANKVKEISEAIDYTFGNRSETVRDQLKYNAAMIADADSRLSSMDERVEQKLKMPLRSLRDYRAKEYVDAGLADLQNQAQDLRQRIDDPTTPAGAKAEAIKDFNRIDDKIRDIGRTRSVVEAVAVLNDTTLNPSELSELENIKSDSDKIYARRDIVDRDYKNLTSLPLEGEQELIDVAQAEDSYAKQARGKMVTETFDNQGNPQKAFMLTPGLYEISEPADTEDQKPPLNVDITKVNDDGTYEFYLPNGVTKATGLIDKLKNKQFQRRTDINDSERFYEKNRENVIDYRLDTAQSGVEAGEVVRGTMTSANTITDNEGRNFVITNRDGIERSITKDEAAEEANVKRLRDAGAAIKNLYEKEIDRITTQQATLQKQIDDVYNKIVGVIESGASKVRGASRTGKTRYSFYTVDEVRQQASDTIARYRNEIDLLEARKQELSRWATDTEITQQVTPDELRNYVQSFEQTQGILTDARSSLADRAKTIWQSVKDLINAITGRIANLNRAIEVERQLIDKYNKQLVEIVNFAAKKYPATDYRSLLTQEGARTVVPFTSTDEKERGLIGEMNRLIEEGALDDFFTDTRMSNLKEQLAEAEAKKAILTRRLEKVGDIGRSGIDSLLNRARESFVDTTALQQVIDFYDRLSKNENLAQVSRGAEDVIRGDDRDVQTNDGGFFAETDGPKAKFAVTGFMKSAGNMTVERLAEIQQKLANGTLTEDLDSQYRWALFNNTHDQVRYEYHVAHSGHNPLNIPLYDGNDIRVVAMYRTKEGKVIPVEVKGADGKSKGKVYTSMMLPNTGNYATTGTSAFSDPENITQEAIDNYTQFRKDLMNSKSTVLKVVSKGRGLMLTTQESRPVSALLGEDKTVKLRVKYNNAATGLFAGTTVQQGSVYAVVNNNIVFFQARPFENVEQDTMVALVKQWAENDIDPEDAKTKLKDEMSKFIRFGFTVDGKNLANDIFVRKNGNIVIGGSEYNKAQVNRGEADTALYDFLNRQKFNVKNSLLTKDAFRMPYLEDGKIKYQAFKTYQDYLLSDDGRVPILTTHTVKTGRDNGYLGLQALNNYVVFEQSDVQQPESASREEVRATINLPTTPQPVVTTKTSNDPTDVPGETGNPLLDGMLNDDLALAPAPTQEEVIEVEDDPYADAFDDMPASMVMSTESARATVGALLGKPAEPVVDASQERFGEYQVEAKAPRKVIPGIKSIGLTSNGNPYFRKGDTRYSWDGKRWVAQDMNTWAEDKSDKAKEGALDALGKDVVADIEENFDVTENYASDPEASITVVEPAPTTPTDIPTLDDVDTDDAGSFYMRVSDATSTGERVDTEQAIKNLQKILPDTPTYIFEGLIGSEQAFGEMDKYGNILISSLAPRGVEYHEAWHKNSQFYMTEDELNNFYKDFTDRMGEQQDVEESAANAFQDFAVDGILHPALRESFVEKMFRKIMNFISSIFGGPKRTSVANEFAKLRKGRTGAPVAQVKSKSRFSKILPAGEQKQLIQSMASMFTSALRDRGVELTSLEFDKEKVGIAMNGIFSLDPKEPFTVYKKMVRSMQEYNKLNPDQAARINGIHKAVVTNYDTVIKELLDYIGTTYGMKIKYDPTLAAVATEAKDLSVEDNEEVTGEAVTENEGGNKNKADWISTIEISPIDQMPAVIRILFNTIPKLKDGRPVLNSIGLPEMVNGDKLIKTVHNALAGKYTLEQQAEALTELRLKGVDGVEILEKKLAIVNSYANRDLEGAMLLQKFRQQFAKDNTEFVITRYQNGETYTTNASEDAKATKIKQEWRTALMTRLRASGVEPINDKLYLDTDSFPDSITSPKVAREFMFGKLGVDVALPLEGDLVESYMDKAQNILDQLKKNPTNVDDLFAVEYSERGGIKGDLNYFLQKAVAARIDTGEATILNADGKRIYNIKLPNYLSKVVNQINNGGFRVTPFNKRSKWRVNGLKLELGLGVRSVDLDEGKTDVRMSDGERMSRDISNMINGRFGFTQAADKSEMYVFATSLPLVQDFDEFFDEYLKDYMLDEIESAQYVASLREQGINYAVNTIDPTNKKTPGKPTDLDYRMRIFHEAFTSAHGDYRDAVAKATTDEAKLALVNSPLVRESIRNTIEDRTERIYQEMVANELTDGKNLGKGIDANAKSFTQSPNVLARLLAMNDFISKVEQDKLFVGDGMFYADKAKRTPMYQGSKKVPENSEAFNGWLESYYETNPRNDGKEPDGLLRIATYDDVITGLPQDVYNDMVTMVGEDIASEYLNVNEADAQGIMSLDEYREHSLREGDWNQAMEDTFRRLQRGESATGGFYEVFKPKKIQYAGVDEFGIPTGYKLSVFPLMPAMVADGKDSRQIGKLNKWMRDNQVGIATFKSANKFGGRVTPEGKFPALYNEKGELDPSTATPYIRTVSYDSFGTQLDLSKSKDRITAGTQKRKQIVNNLIGKVRLTTRKGVLDAQQVLKDYMDTLNKITEANRKELLKKLDLRQEGDNYIVKDIEKLGQTLLTSATSRDLPANQIDSIKEFIRLTKLSMGGTEGLKPDSPKVEILVNRNKIENILVALVNSTAISQKLPGDSRVQVASTGFETKARKFDVAKDKQYLTDNEELKFYKLNTENGSIDAMEVLLPHWFKELYNVNHGEVDPKLLEIVGYRIPTEGLGSIERIVVKGFLPKEAGSSIVMPSSITVKAGSDYDVDKLNLFVPNYEIVDGKPQYIQPGDDSRAALENKLLEIELDILSAKENADLMFKPNGAGTISDIIKKEIDPIIGTQNDSPSPLAFTDYINSYRTRNSFLVGKFSLGIAALHNSHHVLTQIGKVAFNEAKYVQKHRTQPVIRFAGFDSKPAKLDGIYSTDEKGQPTKEYISQSMGEFNSAYVDIAKDPFIIRTNIIGDNVPIGMMLMRAGVPMKTVIYFMSQPVLREYTRRLSVLSSAYRGDDMSNSKKQETVLAELNAELNAPPVTKALKLKDLKGGLEEAWGSGNPEWKTLQSRVLQDFLHYKNMSNELQDLMAVTNQDKPMANTLSAIDVYEYRASKVNKEGIFTGVDNLIQNTFLKEMKRVYDSVKSLYSDFFITETPVSRAVLDPIKADILSRMTSEDNKIKALDRLKQNYVTYLLQTTKVNGQRINDSVQRLMSGNKSIPNRVLEMQKRYPDNPLLQELFPILTNETDKNGTPIGMDAVRLFNRRFDTFESDLITEGWNELYQKEEEFAHDLLKFVILQSGIMNTSYNFVTMAPSDRYIAMASEILANTRIGKVEAEDFKGWFYRNNVRDNTIVPKIMGRLENGFSPIYFGAYAKRWSKQDNNFRLFKTIESPLGNEYVPVPVAGRDQTWFQTTVTPRMIQQMKDSKINKINSDIMRGDSSFEKKQAHMISVINTIPDVGVRSGLVERAREAKNEGDLLDIYKQYCNSLF